MMLLPGSTKEMESIRSRLAKSYQIMTKKSEALGVLKPLKITCTSSDCGNNLHCFRATRGMKQQGLEGTCRSCGAQLVNWRRVHRRDLSDVTYTFDALKYEMIRHHFWHIPLSQKAVRYALRKGCTGLSKTILKQIRRLVGSASPAYDGRQTPRETSPRANAIHYAQHATASCCRTCIKEWHGIPHGRELNNREIFYLSELAILYLLERIPELNPKDHKLPGTETAATATPSKFSKRHAN